MAGFVGGDGISLPSNEGGVILGEGDPPHPLLGFPHGVSVATDGVSLATRKFVVSCHANKQN